MSALDRLLRRHSTDGRSAIPRSSRLDQVRKSATSSSCPSMRSIPLYMSICAQIRASSCDWCYLARNERAVQVPGRLDASGDGAGGRCAMALACLLPVGGSSGHLPLAFTDAARPRALGASALAELPWSERGAGGRSDRPPVWCDCSRACLSNLFRRERWCRRRRSWRNLTARMRWSSWSAAAHSTWSRRNSMAGRKKRGW